MAVYQDNYQLVGWQRNIKKYGPRIALGFFVGWAAGIGLLVHILNKESDSLLREQVRYDGLNAGLNAFSPLRDTRSDDEMIDNSRTNSLDTNRYILENPFYYRHQN